jgi:hypothetical protein
MRNKTLQEERRVQQRKERPNPPHKQQQRSHFTPQTNKNEQNV